MGTVGGRYADWLDLTADLVSRPATAFPGREFIRQLVDSFQTVVSWNWRETDGSMGFEITPDVPTFPESDSMDFWARNLVRVHPLAHWYLITGDARPTTMGRVPLQVASRRSFELARYYLAPYHLEHQLSIPYQLDASGAYRTFVLAQGGEDYTDDAVELAQRIQPLLAVVGRQSMVLGKVGAAASGGEAGLTGRELAVLVLLQQGWTAQAMAHQLSMSPRTVHSHLANIYRKLGVHDRMRAVIVAQELGLVPVSGVTAPAPALTVSTRTSWPVPKPVGWLMDVAQPRPADEQLLPVVERDGRDAG